MNKLTLQIELTNDAYLVLKRDGRLFNAPEFIGDHDWLFAYEWLTGRMLDRLPAPVSDRKPWPLWAWLRLDGKEKGLRISEHGNWMIKFQKPADQVLLSDYLKWHAPLNRSYLAGYEDSEEEADREYEEFETLLTGEGVADIGDLIEKTKNCRPHQKVWDVVHRSWDRVFDVEKSPTVQATFWQLDLDDVISARQRRPR